MLMSTIKIYYMRWNVSDPNIPDDNDDGFVHHFVEPIALTDWEVADEMGDLFDLPNGDML